MLWSGKLIMIWYIVYIASERGWLGFQKPFNAFKSFKIGSKQITSNFKGGPVFHIFDLNHCFSYFKGRYIKIMVLLKLRNPVTE